MLTVSVGQMCKSARKFGRLTQCVIPLFLIVSVLLVAKIASAQGDMGNLSRVRGFERVGKFERLGSFEIIAYLPDGTTGNSYQGSIRAVGGRAPYHFFIGGGALPSGLTLNSTTGTVTGMPRTAGTSYLKFFAWDANGRYSAFVTHIGIQQAASSSSPINVTVSPASVNMFSGKSQQFSAAVEGTANTAVTWSASAGKVSDNGLFTAPSVSRATMVSITASSAADASKKASATISVNPVSSIPALTIGTTGLPVADVGVSYSATLSASGGSLPYRWSIESGALPSGAQLGAATGTISGVLTNAGSFAFTAAVTDAAGVSSQKNLTLTVTTGSGACGPPLYGCSRADNALVPALTRVPSWGGATGINRVVTDPDFHNPIVRVTDATIGTPSNTYCTGLDGSGDVPQLWNSDSTLLLACDGNGNYFPISFDPANFKSLGPLYGTDPVFISGPGVFSHSNPNMFYAFTKGKLFSLDYSNRTTRPTPQLMYDFHTCGVASVGWQSIGGSDTDDTVFSDAFSLTEGQGTGYFIAVYNSSTNVCFNLNTSTGMVTRYPGAVPVGRVNIPDRFYIHNMKMKGGTALVVAQSACISNCSGSPYAWIIGTTQMYALGSTMGGGHWAVGCGKWLNQPGDLYEYNVVREFENPSLWTSVWSVPAGQCGGPSRPACTQPFDAHPAWLGDCSDTGPVCMATVSTNDVVEYPYQNEIVCFTTDGSNRRIRFAHTYSSLALQGFDAQWSIGQPSQDGRFYAWTTKAGGQFGCINGASTCAADQTRSDVLVVKLQ